MRSPGSRPARLLIWPSVLLLLVTGLVMAARLTIEWHWFAQFGFEAVLLRRQLLQLLAFVVVFGLGSFLQLRQLQRCWRLRDQPRRTPPPPSPLLAMGSRGLVAVLLLLLLTLATGLCFLWVQARELIGDPFNAQLVAGLSVVGRVQPAVVLLLSALLILPLWRWPLTGLRLILGAALAASATALARGWSLWLPALLAAPFGEVDPLTGLDLSFTVLRIPALRLLLSVLLVQALVGAAACLLITLSAGTALTDLRFPGLSRDQQRVLQPQFSLLGLISSVRLALAPFDLMVEGTGVASGAGFVDLHLRLPLRLLLALLLLLVAMAMALPLRRQRLRRGLVIGLGAAGLLVPLLEAVLTPIAQRLLVQPRELAVEFPYLTRTIAATRRAFGLERVRTVTLAPRQQITAADLATGPGTIANIRLWDSQPLLATNRQLQQLRLYYTFSSAAVDRYPLHRDGEAGVRQQVLIAAREMDTGALPSGSRTWLNRHLVFTNGHGFTVSPVNTAGPDGLPIFLVRDLGRSRKVRGSPAIGVSDAQAAQALPIGNPSLYFTSGPAPYVIAPTRVEEFAYPEGELNIYTHYTGRREISLANPWLKLAAAVYLNEPRVLFSGALTDQSRLLLRRQVNRRLEALAPFLRFEGQPYLVTVRLPERDGYRSSQHQYWLLDGFTTSRSYPYSDPNPAGIRWFRNPVKAVVDAHDGRLWIYVSDRSDPVLKTWQRAFPELFQSLDRMPRPLQDHIRVPQSQFSIQAERLLRYHVTDTRTFYNGDDVWSIPVEIYGNKQVPVSPYHVTMQLPGKNQAEFVLLLPFTPLRRPNLVGWLAARNDQPHYGELVLVRFPQQRLLLGPQQISSLTDQDPQISFQFGLWNRFGSRLFRGNMLVLPIGNGLLYVEPIYLQSEGNSLPTLVRVVVSDGRRFVMEKDLSEALKQLVRPRTAAAPAGLPAALQP